jgi:hypothetical protein
MSRTGTPKLRLLVLVFIRRCVRLFAWVADHLQFLTFLHTHTCIHTHFDFILMFILFYFSLFPFSGGVVLQVLKVGQTTSNPLEAL